MCDTEDVRGSEFLRKIRTLGVGKNVDVRFVASHGKGSHGTLYYGPRFTTLKDRNKELSAGLVAAMCKQLGVDRNEL